MGFCEHWKRAFQSIPPLHAGERTRLLLLANLNAVFVNLNKHGISDTMVMWPINHHHRLDQQRRDGTLRLGRNILDIVLVT